MKLFKDPININISTQRKLKSSKRHKLDINVNVSHKDFEISPSNMSWGEKDRLSIALSLTINKNIR